MKSNFLITTTVEETISECNFKHFVTAVPFAIHKRYVKGKFNLFSKQFKSSFIANSLKHLHIHVFINVRPIAWNAQKKKVFQSRKQLQYTELVEDLKGSSLKVTNADGFLYMFYGAIWIRVISRGPNFYVPCNSTVK